MSWCGRAVLEIEAPRPSAAGSRREVLIPAASRAGELRPSAAMAQGWLLTTVPSSSMAETWSVYRQPFGHERFVPLDQLLSGDGLLENGVEVGVGNVEAKEFFAGSRSPGR